MKTIIFSTYTFVPDAIIKAFSYIKDRFPSVQKVQYDEDGKWTYINADGSTPEFDSSIDVGILEAGSDAAYSQGYPICFSLFVENELATCRIQGRPPVVLTQIEPELWDVTVGTGASTTWNTLELALLEFTESINCYVKE